MEEKITCDYDVVLRNADFMDNKSLEKKFREFTGLFIVGHRKFPMTIKENVSLEVAKYIQAEMIKSDDRVEVGIKKHSSDTFIC